MHKSLSPHPFLVPTLAATQALAKQIAPHLRKSDVLALRGELGAGKTEFARSLLHELGVTGDIPSPTFTLLQTYETKNFLISHFDLYRLKSADELDELGWDDALADSVTIVEWPEQAQNRLPTNYLELHFMLASDGMRNVILAPFGTWLERF